MEHDKIYLNKIQDPEWSFNYKKNKLNDSFLIKFYDLIDWNHVIINQKLSEQTLNNLIDDPNILQIIKNYIYLIIRNQNITEKFARKCLTNELIDFDDLTDNSDFQFSNELIQDYMEDINRNIQPFLFNINFSEEILINHVISNKELDDMYYEGNSLFQNINNLIIKNQILSENFLDKMNEIVEFDKENYLNISIYQTLSNEFIIKNIKNLDIESITKFQNLSLDTIKFIYDFLEKIINDIEFYKYLDDDYFDKILLLYNSKIFDNLIKNKFFKTELFFNYETYNYLKPYWNYNYKIINIFKKFQKKFKK